MAVLRSGKISNFDRYTSFVVMLCLLCPVSAAQAFTLDSLGGASVVIPGFHELATLLLIVPGLLLLARRSSTRK